MLSLRLFSRNVTPQSAVSVQRLHTSIRLFDSDSDSDKPDKKKTVKDVQSKKGKPEENSASIKKLNVLLQKMLEEPRIKKTVDVAVKPRKAKAEANDSVVDKSKLFEDKLVSAAKEVAASLGGDVKQTQSELLAKILSSKSEDTGAARTQEGETKVQQPMNLGKLIQGMKIDRNKKHVAESANSRAWQVQRAVQGTKQRPRSDFQKPKQRFTQQTTYKVEQKVNLDGGAPLGIFKKDSKFDERPDTPSLSTWKALENRALKLAVTHPPSNVFQQMILWTDQGKLWQFPIDNEQGLEEEQNVHFSEHVFVERHLEEWCPRKGPIRHFMELVCVGLSKNPYMTVKQKVDHITWFKEYFDSKQDLLKELGVYKVEATDAKTERIEAQ